jgi:hypothetical protein
MANVFIKDLLLKDSKGLADVELKTHQLQPIWKRK